jgi:hypothetical protein
MLQLLWKTLKEFLKNLVNNWVRGHKPAIPALEGMEAEGL